MGLRLLALARHGNVSRTVARAHTSVAILGGIGEFHYELVAFAIQDRRLEAEFVTKMQLLQNLIQAGAVRFWCCVQILAAGFACNVVGSFPLLSRKPPDVRRAPIAQTESNRPRF